jgi:hypothetical protein
MNIICYSNSKEMVMFKPSCEKDHHHERQHWQTQARLARHFGHCMDWFMELAVGSNKPLAATSHQDDRECFGWIST